VSDTFVHKKFTISIVRETAKKTQSTIAAKINDISTAIVLGLYGASFARDWTQGDE
jgi:hypothetical protein